MTTKSIVFSHEKLPVVREEGRTGVPAITPGLLSTSRHGFLDGSHHKTREKPDFWKTLGRLKSVTHDSQAFFLLKSQ